MNKVTMLYEGKAKRVYTTEDQDLYIMEFKDDATAFNGEKKGTIDNKGVMNNAISESLYKILMENGIPTHFVEKLNDRDTLVKAVKIIPIEVLVRNVAAGSLTNRLGIAEGTELPMTVLEFCYKNDELGDPQINEYHIEAMQLATKAQVETIKIDALRINEILKKIFIEKGIRLIDFKLEFGVHKGEVILADEISPDTCRLWDLATNEKLDKDRFRRNLGNIEEAYKEILSRLGGGANE
jgi:phosphoribosylaminoimidazole-succinocarboxamide synthase